MVLTIYRLGLRLVLCQWMLYRLSRGYTVSVESMLYCASGKLYVPPLPLARHSFYYTNVLSLFLCLQRSDKVYISMVIWTTCKGLSAHSL